MFRLGLGSSRCDLEVQGEVDFDFFDDPSSSNPTPQEESKVKIVVEAERNDSTVTSGEVLRSFPTNKIEMTIPSPEEYSGNNCAPVNFQDTDVKTSSLVVHQNSDTTKSTSDLSNLSTSESDLTTSLSEDGFEDEDSDSMTDVTPLLSQSTSPLNPPSSFLTITEPEIIENESNRITTIKKDVSTNGVHSGDMGKLLEAIKGIEVKKKSPCKPKAKSPSISLCRNNQRQNHTFSNDEIRIIDLENKHLLNRIQQQKKRPTPQVPGVQLPRPATAGINRLKQQRQIELENMALLRRLESTKASRDLNRTKLLGDHDHRSMIPSRSFTRCSSQNTSQISSCCTSAISFRTAPNPELNPFTVGRLKKPSKKPPWKN